MGSVLITGGAGFVGRYFASALASNGSKVSVLDDLSCANSSFDCPQLQNPNIDCIRGSIMDASLISSLVAEHQIIVHFASVVGVEETISRPFDTAQNLNGTINVARALRSDNIAMFGSSADVYGAHSHHYRGAPMRENDLFVYEHAGINRWVYPHVKALEENMFINSAARCVTIRFFNSYGPDMDFPAPKRVLPHFIESALSGSPLRLSGTGRQIRSLCHIDDTVRGLMLALNYAGGLKESSNECFNLGSDDPVSIRELATKFATLAYEEGLTAEPLPIIENAFSYTQAFDDSWDRVPDISRAKELLGFEPGVSLDEGLRETIRYYNNVKIERRASGF